VDAGRKANNHRHGQLIETTVTEHLPRTEPNVGKNQDLQAPNPFRDHQFPFFVDLMSELPRPRTRSTTP